MIFNNCDCRRTNSVVVVFELKCFFTLTIKHKDFAKILDEIERALSNFTFAIRAIGALKSTIPLFDRDQMLTQ